MSQKNSCYSTAKAGAFEHSHDKAVESISDSVRDFYDRKQKFRIFHSSTNSTRQSTVTRKNIVDTSSLSHVLEVNTERRTALVEPNVPMDRLVEETIRYGLVPPVVIEFPGITAGGGYAGTSGESISFKHGFFNQTINYTEMVLANGDVVRCSEDERPDLFHGAAGAVGTYSTLDWLRPPPMKTRGPTRCLGCIFRYSYRIRIVSHRIASHRIANPSSPRLRSKTEVHIL